MAGVNGIVSAVRVVRVRAILAGLLLAWLVVVSGAVRADRAIATGPPASAGLARQLAARDPGARVGGNTIVATGNGVRVFGVLRRPNFIAALGSRVTIVGGEGNDQLGALGDDATIRAGRGADLIYGGRGAKLIGGSGRDLLVDAAADATVELVGSGSDAIVSGRDDRVLCARGSRHDVIYAGKSVRISATCRADGARVLPLRRLRGRAPFLAARASALATASAVTGNGSNEHPFVSPCDDPNHVDCTVSAFEVRPLTKPWQNEYVPAYRCPADHGYLLRRDYDYGGLTTPFGVQIQQDWGRPYPIGISITGVLTRDGLTAGTATGFPNSSATNWIAGGSHWYKVILHCTSDRCHGLNYFRTDFPPPGCAFAGDRADAQVQIRRLSWNRISLAAAGSGGDAARAGSAARLAALDPGARVDGNTVVVTGDGASVFGTPNRPNYILALGSRETIVGGARGADELGALGSGVTIRAGRGNDFVYGGPGGMLIGAGGRDVLIDTKAAAKVLLTSSGHQVMVSGRNDRVLCSPRARNEFIYLGPSASVERTCRANGNRVLPLSSAGSAEFAPDHAHAAAVTGDGSNEHPFVAPCDDPQNVVCTVSGFKERPMSGPPFTNEYVPAYRCPSDHPYLRRLDYAPFGTELPRGVEIQESSHPWPIGVSISGIKRVFDPKFGSRQVATTTGYPNSSATLWNPFGKHWYRVVLHCTSDLRLASR